MNAPDLIVTHARLWSRGRSVTDADAFAVKDGRIVARGRAELLAERGPRTRVIDACGATVTPGLTDAHVHLLSWARGRAELDLHGATSAKDAAHRVGEFAAARPGAGTLVGRGWDANGWPEPPARALLDAVCPRRPVVLHSRDFHNVWLNSTALAAAGITRATVAPDGGVVHRDLGGEPTGWLQEHAAALAAPLEAASGDDGARLDDAIRALHALGVTGVHDFEGADAHRMLRRRAAGPGPRLRTLMHLPHARLDAAIAVGIESGLGDDAFRLGAVKLFADGTLGSRTAALLAPYDGTTGTGTELLSPAALRDTVGRAVEHGWSVAVHAIGDRAVRSALDAFEAVRDRLPGLALPPRIEHVQLLDPADAPRFAALGVAASMQPSHCVSDIALAERWWSSRREWTYPWRALHDAGARLVFGSDAPVEPPSVTAGLHAALARRPPGTTRAYVPSQAIDLDLALSAYTEGPARLAGSWPRTGTLDVGGVADFVVWNADLHGLEADGIAAAMPARTVLGGEVVHDAGGDVVRELVRGAGRHS